MRYPVLLYMHEDNAVERRYLSTQVNSAGKGGGAME